VKTRGHEHDSEQQHELQEDGGGEEESENNMIFRADKEELSSKAGAQTKVNC